MGKGDKGYGKTFPVPEFYFETGITDAATVAHTITADHEILEIDSLGQGTTLNLTISGDIETGAELFLKMTCGATPYDLILGTSTDASVIRGIASTIKWIYLVYNGTAYQLISENLIGTKAGSYKTSAMSATGTQAITITAFTTFIDGVTTQATGNRTLNLTVTGAPTGAILLISHKTAASQTLTHGTNITAPVVTGEAGKTMTQAFIFNGTAFLPTGTHVKID
ncbi:hypothetical protein ES703_109111 [subsurface metagenome]